MLLVLPALLALWLAVAQAHYVYPGLLYNGKKSNDWQYVRMTINKANKAPVEDVMSDAIRCDQDPSGSIAETLTVTAGSTIGFVTDNSLYHPGALQFYMAKVPEGDTAASWDGSGAHWFKIYQDNVTVSASGQITWPSMGVSVPSVELPASLPNGDYLIRVEHIAVHVAYSEGGAQFYLACGQINVSGGGNGKPSPLVAFPGAYSPTDPGILFDMYSPQTSYTPPGPAVWTG
ncbi:hypothetical protein V495_00808 [Pseudogymnoascus sp. VKM F-4514 (FW-929)]|nr:hypothetical protein V495_00808 [Pseudogymnoascus sp. VKM F-4514 (FW-929)]KFY59418.1 hypothetical protein V497_04283 [Pseudogymnoascus sp. VKM F-4516 (FW-969)]